MTSSTQTFPNDQRDDQSVGSVMYDSVIVGTSPVSLLEAIHLAETGKRVRVIERESSLGGAWRVSNCLGLSAVEVSPHLLVADPVVHEVISRKFEIELEVVDPAPMYRFWGPKYKKFKREYPIQNQLGEDLRSLLTAARSSRRETVMLPLDMLVSLKKFAKLSRIPVVYPKGGLVRLLENAARILDKLGVEVTYGANASKVEWVSGSPGHHVVTASVGEIQTKQVALPTVFNIDGFGYDGRDVPAYFLDNHSTHLVFKARTAVPGQLRFLKVTGSPYFELINDVTPYCVGDVSANERIIACRCARSLSFDEEHINEYIDHLRELNYLPEGDELVDYRVTEADDRVLTYFMRARLERLFGDGLVFLGATDLHMTNAIREFNSTRWNFV